MKVFLTGASSGIGVSIARHYAIRGASLGLFARRSDALAQVASTLPSAECATYVGDVRDAQALRAAADQFLSRFGPPDIVIANAGISIGTLTTHADDNAQFRAIFDTNVLGIVHTFQPFLPALTSARHGKLVGIASVAGFRGVPGSGAYSASKAAAITYLESLRVELTGSGVAVLTVCPGFIETPMTAGNPYRMPFMISADKAGGLIVRAIDKGKTFYVLPWQMKYVGKILRVLPRPLYDRFSAKAKRKPRANA